MKLQPPHALGAIMLCLGISLCSCATRAAGPSVELKGKHFDIEIAADDAARARGLMFRDAMPADHAMLFLFERPAMQAFWMKNTHIPLDILYFDQNYSKLAKKARNGRETKFRE